MLDAVNFSIQSQDKDIVEGSGSIDYIEKVKIETEWKKMFDMYDPIAWDSNIPETILDLKIENPKEMINHALSLASEQLESDGDAKIYTTAVSLTIRIANENYFQISDFPSLSKILTKLCDKYEDSYKNLDYSVIYILLESAEMALEMFSDEDPDDISILKRRLIDLSGKCSTYLRNPDEVDEEDAYVEKPENFDPHDWGYINGEEEYYNHTNKSIDTANDSYKKYNISEYTNENCICFKSSGLFIKVYSDGNCKVDFTPYNSTSAGDINRVLAMRMLYKGITNFFYAIKNDEIKVDDKSNLRLSGSTNKIMAQFAVMFGFKAGIGGEMLSADEIKDRMIKMDDDYYWVSGDIQDIESAIDKIMTDTSLTRLRERILSSK